MIVWGAGPCSTMSADRWGTFWLLWPVDDMT